jgi:hypothetical protein
VKESDREVGVVSRKLAKQVLSQLSYTPTRRTTLILKHLPIGHRRKDQGPVRQKAAKEENGQTE